MNVLVLCGDYWHPAEVVQRGLADFPAKDIRFDFVEDAKDILTPALLDDYDVIMNCKMDCISAANQHEWFQPGVTEVMPADLRAWVERGGGFLAVHGGTSFYREDTSGYIDLVGNHFVSHPPRCDIRFHIAADHPITRGIPDFTYRDEQYQLATLAPDLEVLATTRSEAGGEQLGCFVRHPGAGRLCVLTPGHILETWRRPEFRQLLEQALRWCAGD